ncbi:hypothetical protein HMPREF9176_1941 [Streptococcus downei F0415]|uniref:Uncharacterized protein n=1 Tax=Streptococcus downei MFe28 TaxID=764290 RepID=A0A380JH96_STRDO|nr:hypothetical protein HMPREF9176_1941 [Streptococcus downei F0415]SUN36827.1 Uncharacterised protein [Streptococcus downei MFe28]
MTGFSGHFLMEKFSLDLVKFAPICDIMKVQMGEENWW